MRPLPGSPYAAAVTAAAFEQQMPPASEQLLREHAEGLRALGAKLGVTKLRVAGRAGWLVGAVAPGRDMLDMAQFEVEVEQLIGAGVRLFSERVLTKDGVSLELLDATPL